MLFFPAVYPLKLKRKREILTPGKSSHKKTIIAERRKPNRDHPPAKIMTVTIAILARTKEAVRQITAGKAVVAIQARARIARATTAARDGMRIVRKLGINYAG